MAYLDHNTYMAVALEEARLALFHDEVPIGAVLVHKDTGDIAARLGNRTIMQSDPTAHAEILVIRQLCKDLGSQRIPHYNLYVTLEPCAMCTAAIAFARIPNLFIGALDQKGGGVYQGHSFLNQPTCHHKINVQYRFLEQECSQILKDFFKSKRS